MTRQAGWTGFDDELRAATVASGMADPPSCNARPGVDGIGQGVIEVVDVRKSETADDRLKCLVRENPNDLRRRR